MRTIRNRKPRVIPDLFNLELSAFVPEWIKWIRNILVGLGLAIVGMDGILNRVYIRISGLGARQNTRCLAGYLNEFHNQTDTRYHPNM